MVIFWGSGAVRRAPAFAKASAVAEASTFAGPTADRTADKTARQAVSDVCIPCLHAPAFAKATARQAAGGARKILPGNAHIRAHAEELITNLRGRKTNRGKKRSLLKIRFEPLMDANSREFREDSGREWRGMDATPTGIGNVSYCRVFSGAIGSDASSPWPLALGRRERFYGEAKRHDLKKAARGAIRPQG